MLFRISAATIVACLLIGGSAQAQEQTQVPQIQVQHVQFRSLTKLPDPRGEFVRQCAPHMIGRWAHPEAVCSCLHDHAAAAVEDNDLREALMRGFRESGVSTIESYWEPPATNYECY